MLHHSIIENVNSAGLIVQNKEIFLGMNIHITEDKKIEIEMEKQIIEIIEDF